MNFYSTVNEYKNRFLDQISLSAKSLFNEPLPFLDEYFEDYFQTGNRISYEKGYFLRRKHLMVFGIMSIIDGDAKYIQHLEDVIRCICEEETWALPAHINRKNPHWRITVDLFAAETAQALAEIVWQSNGKLSAETCSIVRDNIRYRVLEPFVKSPTPYASWEKGINNWNAVCCSSIGSTLLDMYDKTAEEWAEDKTILRITDSLDRYLDGFSDDGACLEGLAYLNYGLYYYIGFSCKLLEKTGGRIDLTKRNEDKLREIAGYFSHAYFEKGASVSFSDSDSYECFRPGLAFKLNSLFPETEIPCFDSVSEWDTDFNYRWLSEYRDIIWTQEWLNVHSADQPLYANNLIPDDFAVYDYPLAQQTIIHGKEDIGISVKGGNNAEPHNHNDLGSFSVVKEGKVILADLGYGLYNRDYFNENRYLNICTRSAGHNVPIVNGNEQKNGAEFKVSEYSVSKDIEKGQASVFIDFGNAYGKNITLARSISIRDKGKYLKIEDTSNAQLTEHLIALSQPIINSTDILVSDCRIITGENAGINITCQKWNDHNGIIRDVWIISIACDTSSEMEIYL